MEILVFAWLVAPIVLGIMLIINKKKNKQLRAQNNEKLQMLESQKELLNEYRKQNKALQQALREAREGVQNQKVDITKETEGVANAVAESADSGVLETVAKISESEAAETVAKISESVAAETVAKISKSEAAETVTEIREAETVTEIRESEAAETVTEIPESGVVEKMPTASVAKTVEKAAKKQKAGIAPGTVMFGIGILLILAAGAIFATTTWNILPAFGKIAVLLGAVAVFYGGAFVAEKKLELRNTSITFYILGSTFLAIINLAAGYFEWYGPYYSLNGDGGTLLWSISALITAVSMIIGALIYKTKVLGMIGYYSLILSVVLFNVFMFDDLVPTMISVGIVLLLSHAYVLFVENERGIDVIGTSARFITYAYHAVAFFTCLLYYGFFSDEEPTLWPIVGLVVLATFNVALAMWRMLTEFGEDDITNTLEERLECVKKVNIIFTELTIVSFAVSFRVPFQLYQRLNICLFVFLIIYAILLVLERKDIVFDRIRKINAWFAEITLLVVMISEFWNFAPEEMNPKGIILLATAIILYVMEHIAKDNRKAVISASTIYASIIYIMYLYHNPDSDANIIITVVLAWIIGIAAVIAGRFIYREVAKKTEAGMLIDWISICSIMMFIFAGICGSGKDWLDFVSALLIAGYIASFYKRSNYIADRVLLTVATVLAMYICNQQPFFEIPYEWDSEWNTVFLLATTAIVAFVWRKHKKAVSILWVVAIAVSFMNQLDTADSYSYGERLNLGLIKVVIYLAGMIALFIVSFITKKKTLLVETGFAMVGFSVLAWSFDAKGIFILAGVFGIAYLVYLHIKRMSKWAFLPIIQIYILLFALELAIGWWFVVYAVAMVAGFGLHLLWDSANEKSFADDMVNISAIVPIIVLWADGGDKWTFGALIMLAVYVLSFYRRYNDNPYALINKALLTLSSVIIAAAWITEPWFEVSESWKAEWIILAFMGVCLFNMLVVYRHATDELWGWITFAVALISAVIQGENAIATGDVYDALVLGIVMLGVLIWAFIAKKKQWFLLAGITLIAQSIYASRKFWMSIAWWVYLLAAGAILIIIAARSEYKRRKGIDEEPDKPHAFADWTL